MNKPFDLNDDLSDLLDGETVVPFPRRELPQAAEFARIRETVPEFTESCPKCGGTGAFRAWSGRSVGRCFTCQGKGKLTFKTSPEKRAQARQRTQEVKAEVRDTYKAERAWLGQKLASPGLPEGYAKMLRDFQDKLEAGRELTEGQLGVIQRGMARDEEYASRRAQKAQERQAAAPVVDASRIVEAVQRGKKSGLIWVSLRFDGIVIQEAKKHPGVLYVKTGTRDAAYLGKIQDGRFLASRICTPEQQAKIILIASDPAAAAKVYGNLTGSCCVCGRELTNKQSIEEGIGPVCADRVGFTSGGIRVPVEQAPF